MSNSNYLIYISSLVGEKPIPGPCCPEFIGIPTDTLYVRLSVKAVWNDDLTTPETYCHTPPES